MIQNNQSHTISHSIMMFSNSPSIKNKLSKSDYMLMTKLNSWILGAISTNTLLVFTDYCNTDLLVDRIMYISDMFSASKNIYKLPKVSENIKFYSKAFNLYETRGVIHYMTFN